MHQFRLLQFAVLLTACNSKSVTEQNNISNNRPAANNTVAQQQQAISQPDVNTSALSQITLFTANETNTVFTAPGGWELKDFETGDRLTVQLNGQPAGHFDFSKRPYSGPGFAVYRYAVSDDAVRCLLLVEAQADPGTAWYCAGFIENNHLVKQLFIDEPRSNSEIHAVQDYLQVFKTTGKYVFRFNKKMIAAYSKIPGGMRQDEQYVYMEVAGG